MYPSRKTGPRHGLRNRTPGHSHVPSLSIFTGKNLVNAFFFYLSCLHAACRRRAIALIIFAVRYRESLGRLRSRSQTQSRLIYLVRVLFFVGQQTRDFFSRRTNGEKVLFFMVLDIKKKKKNPRVNSCAVRANPILCIS